MIKGSPKNRFVTTLRTHPDRDRETLYLIRSYDHEERSDPSTSTAPTRRSTAHTKRSNTGATARTGSGLSGDMLLRPRRETKQSDTINHGKAQHFHIWEVARAATAARFYFEPLKIEIRGSSDPILFEDGGFSFANNPTLEGTNELEDLYGTDSIGIVVSVGTARKDESRKKASFYKTIPRATKKFAANATDPEAAHKSMKRKAREAESKAKTTSGAGFSYHRLNDPGRLEVELDEWEPKKGMFSKASGSETLAKIESAFAAWMTAIEVHDELRHCATVLVENRRSRVKDEDKWERFATGARFKCRARRRKCVLADFLDRTLFREHLETEHTDGLSIEEEIRACRKTWRYMSAT